MITASALARVMACPSSECLVKVIRQSTHADAGTARHQYLENVSKFGAEHALDMLPAEYRDECSAINLEGLPVNLKSEVAFAYDWHTGNARLLDCDGHRDYSSVSENEIPGTIDVVGVSDDSIYVGDFKGFLDVEAKDNAQLLIAALALSKVYDKDTATIEIINIKGSYNKKNSETVDVFDLLKFETSLKKTMQAVLDVKSGDLKPEFYEGEHCKYCPGFDSCPAKTKMLRRMTDGSLGNELEILNPLSPADATHAYRTYKAMEELTKRARKIIYAYAADRPIDLGGGVVFGAREKLGNEKLDGDCVYHVVREQLGQEAADIAVKRTATKTGIAEAIKASKIEGTQKAATDRILDEVRERGGAHRDTTKTIDEHRAELPPHSAA